jgi:hypothetical protein
MRRVPRQSLAPEFLRAVRASGHSRVTLAALAQFAAHNQLSSLLNARRVPASALNVQRLHALAVAISYDGPVFKAVAR